MAAATDAQMQAFADSRIRPRAEQLRALLNACRDDKAAIDEVYDRAANGAAWNDARLDGPPNLLGSQDVLVYNAFISLLVDILDGVAGVEAGTSGEQKIFQLHANLPQFQSACVRPLPIA